MCTLPLLNLISSKLLWDLFENLTNFVQEIWAKIVKNYFPRLPPSVLENQAQLGSIVNTINKALTLTRDPNAGPAMTNQVKTLQQNFLHL